MAPPRWILLTLLLPLLLERISILIGIAIGLVTLVYLTIRIRRELKD